MYTQREFPNLTQGLPSTSKGWRVQSQQVENCSRAPSEASISLASDVYSKITIALDEMGQSEWLGYLLGEVKGNRATVDGIIIPPQEVTTGSVRVLETPENPRIIGTVHSHGGSGGAFSSTDERHIMAHHPVTMLAALSGLTGVLRVSLPCGSQALVKATVRVAVPEDEEFRAELRAKTRAREAVYQQQYLDLADYMFPFDWL